MYNLYDRGTEVQIGELVPMLLIAAYDLRMQLKYGLDIDDSCTLLKERLSICCNGITTNIQTQVIIILC